jgi:hypothetical protein
VARFSCLCFHGAERPAEREQPLASPELAFGSEMTDEYEVKRVSHCRCAPRAPARVVASGVSRNSVNELGGLGSKDLNVRPLDYEPVPARQPRPRNATEAGFIEILRREATPADPKQRTSVAKMSPRPRLASAASPAESAQRRSKWSLGLRTKNGTGNGQPANATGNRQPATENRQPETGNRQHQQRLP